MKLCSDNCHPICDFCKHYKDNRKSNKEPFEGEGVCLQLNKQVDCSEGDNCKEFHCINANKGEQL